MDWAPEIPVKTISKHGPATQGKGMTMARTAFMPTNLPALIRTMVGRIGLRSVIKPSREDETVGIAKNAPQQGVDRSAWIEMLDAVGLHEIRHRQTQIAPEAALASPAQVQHFLDDVRGLAQEFNRLSREHGLGVTVDPSGLVVRVQAGYHDPVAAYFDGSDLGGRVYENQIDTLARAHLSLLREPAAPHVILGMMQSGKTLTAILLLWHAVIFYLMTGIALSPLYLLPDFIDQEAQAGVELERFLLFYGFLEFRFDRSMCTALPACAGDGRDALGHTPTLSLTTPQIHPHFTALPTLRTYLSTVLHLEGPAAMIVRRSQSFGALDRQLERMISHALVPMPVLDEVQYGAAGSGVRRCLTAQIMERIEALTVHGRPPRVISTSATPFAETGPQAVRVVRQRLPDDYCGITHFKGESFPGAENARPLPIFSFSEARDAFDLPMIGQINMNFYTQSIAGRLSLGLFRKWASKTGYAIAPGSAAETATAYAAFVVDSLRTIVLRLAMANGGLAHTGKPRGLCVRVRNNNAEASALVERLGLDADGIDVIAFFGPLNGRSLRQLIAERPHPARPYLIVVTARARMSNAVPREVEHFIDFTERNTEYNALLQGFVGRAMGAGKRSAVILSDDNARILRDYIATGGEMTMRATRHGYNIGTISRAQETPVLRIERGKHPRFDKMLDVVQMMIVDHGVRGGHKFPSLVAPWLNQIYGRDVKCMLPLLNLVWFYKIDEIIAEQPDLVVPGFAGTARLAGIGDEVRDRDGRTYRYIYDPAYPDFVKVGLRTTDAKGGRGLRHGVLRKGRSSTAIDLSNNSPRSVDHMEPCLGLTAIRGDRYKLDYIDLPLAETARTPTRGVTQVLPTEAHFMNALLAPCEVMQRTYGRAADVKAARMSRAQEMHR
jgi:hypothetical protein